jgi:hypothetical protein
VKDENRRGKNGAISALANSSTAKLKAEKTNMNAHGDPDRGSTPRKPVASARSGVTSNRAAGALSTSPSATNSGSPNEIIVPHLQQINDALS